MSPQSLEVKGQFGGIQDGVLSMAEYRVARMGNQFEIILYSLHESLIQACSMGHCNTTFPY